MRVHLNISFVKPQQATHNFTGLKEGDKWWKLVKKKFENAFISFKLLNLGKNKNIFIAINQIKNL